MSRYCLLTLYILLPIQVIVLCLPLALHNVHLRCKVIRLRQSNCYLRYSCVQHLLGAQYVWSLWGYGTSCSERYTMLICITKRQYLLTCKVSRYCLSALHGSIYISRVLVRGFGDKPSTCSCVVMNMSKYVINSFMYYSIKKEYVVF